MSIPKTPWSFFVFFFAGLLSFNTQAKADFYYAEYHNVESHYPFYDDMGYSHGIENYYGVCDCGICSDCDKNLPFCCAYPFPIVGDFTVAYDDFRSLPDGSWEGNNGIVTSFNLGAPLPYLFSNGLSFQFGSSYGIYDWSGRGSETNRLKESQQQVFITTGISRRTPCCSGLNIGVVFDWLMNRNLGVFAVNADISQVRFKAGYQLYGCDELGVWGTANVHTSHRVADEIPITCNALNQINFFWQHNYWNSAKTMVWAGLPYKKGLMFAPGKDGQYILGASFSVPLTCALSIEGRASYMHPRFQPDGIKPRNYASDVCIGLTYSFGGGCLNRCNQKILDPYFPVANNSDFLIDTNQNF